MNSLISFFKPKYPCDMFIMTHVHQASKTFSKECQCWFLNESNYDIIFKIKGITEENSCAVIELAEDDEWLEDYYEKLLPFAHCLSYKFIWKDENDKTHEYEISEFNTTGQNNGIELVER